MDLIVSLAAGKRNEALEAARNALVRQQRGPGFGPPRAITEPS
jgi:hypothetical protein